ncbi:MAG: Xylose isomerase domain protein TIM barrel [Limisphaerales bacterium]|nr:MAG: Xylose isomerase domain protein TIM barrel [Limisphaerales bacterium]KAG0507459.1 MAG: Xylose isomerase domain protein TIM barrel [Limisphaerales bacterium]TXT47942.1 MAG: Xylose isomerase domain protein TIM barrel [Limisphaerales bacterium]
MLQEIAALGFDHAELSHGIRVSLVPGILDAVDAGEIRISTLHNFCPLPMGVNHAAPNVYQFTARDPRERESALKQTFKTLEFAVRVKARLVVLHMGSLVEMKPKGGFLGLFGPEDFTDTLLDMIEAKEHESPKFQMLIAGAVEQQERLKAEPMQRTAEALKQIAARAAELGLQLGIENREALEEVPLDGEMAQFLAEFPSATVRYWHDTGHAQIKEHLGFLHHVTHLGQLADRLGGLHIHDVEFPGSDHREPGTGTVDFAALKPFVKPEHIKVFEFSPGLKVEEVKRGVAHVRKLWGT